MGGAALLRLVLEVTGEPAKARSYDPICREVLAGRWAEAGAANKSQPAAAAGAYLVSKSFPRLSFSQLAIGPSSSLWDSQSPSVQ